MITEELQEKSPRELLALWQEARDELDRLRAELVVADDVTDKRIETPPRAFTPETVEDIGRLQQRVDDLWRAYRKKRPLA